MKLGNTWVKLSGAYMRSRVGEPSYADVEALGQELVRAAPDRGLQRTPCLAVPMAPGGIGSETSVTRSEHPVAAVATLSPWLPNAA